MKRYNLFRHFISAIALSGILFFAVSCSDQPAPGPMSPVNSKQPLVSGQNQNSTGAVRPLNRQSVVKSLAKLMTYDRQAVLHLQDLYDEVNYIKTTTTNSTLASKMNTVAFKVWEAQDDLNEVPPDNGAVDELNIAKSTLQGISTTLLNATTRNQFIAEINAVIATINTGGTVDHDCRGKTKYLHMKKADGGLLAHCGHKFIIPKNALAGDTNMFIKVNSSSFITVDCGPDGTFNNNVDVYVSYRDADMTGVNVNNLTLAWRSSPSSPWTDIGGLPNAITKLVKALNNHFTEYTISVR